MRKLKIMSLVLLLCVCMYASTGCGESYDGTYYYTYNGYTLTSAYPSIDGDDAVMAFSSGSKFYFTVKVSGTSLTLTSTSSTLTLSGYIYDGTITVYLDGDTLTYVKYD